MPVRMRARLRQEGGYTMIAVIGAISLVSMLAAATLAATRDDVNLVQRDVDYKRAHAAAQAGIADYSFHLNNDNSYWARCTNVPEPNAVNQVGSTVRRRTVPGSTDAEYAIELLPATGKEKCDTTKPVESMLEQSGPNTGSFRIRSTGYAGKAKVAAVATYKRASFLDYVYFTQLETLDPVTYWTQPMIEGAYTQCTKFYREGRASQNIPGTSQPCIEINFVSGDEIKGPLHTNDELLICGTPKFGRNAADTIEVGAPPQGWRANSTCSGNSPTFSGPFVTTAPVLKPPATNGRLKKIAGPSYTFSCQTKIQLEGANMKVTTNAGVSTLPFPSSGVVYVQGGSCPDKPGVAWPACSSAYSPRTATYPPGSDCGTALVSGSYSGELTIAAENDIVVEGSITHSSGTQGLLGMIANNFVRIKHPFCRDKTGSEVGGVEGCPTNKVPAETNPSSSGASECHGGSNATGSLENPKIEAAILAIEHSFIVDHYDCGASLGTLTVKGAISQKFRGTVGTTSPTGYTKSYEYDDRLRYMEPPNFLDPIEPAWHIQRETLDFS
jgi:type II secretory pathway pseudopilin PulG